MLSRSMRSTAPNATATCAVAQIFSYSFSRSAASSFLESFRPRGMRLGSRMTAAATTGPASGPRPASSQPATGKTPLLSARRSRRNVGRRTGSSSGRRARRLGFAGHDARTVRGAALKSMRVDGGLWMTGETTAQNKLNCSVAGLGARKCSVESETLLALSPSFSQAISKRRPIIQA